MHERGGVYADLDVEAYEAVTRWAPQCECEVALMLENDRQFGQYAFAAARPRHPLFAYVAAYAEHKIRNGMFQAGVAGHVGVLEFAGPTMFTIAVLSFISKNTNLTVPAKAATEGGLNRWRSENNAVLRKHGLCMLDGYQMSAFLENHMSSFNPVLQSDALGGSWRQREEEYADMRNKRRHDAAVGVFAGHQR